MNPMNKDDFMEILHGNVEKIYENNRLYLTVPDFFGDGLTLKLVVASPHEGFYVIHDDGSAVAALRSRLPREEWNAPGLAYSGENQRVYAGLPQDVHFYAYLGRLVTIANADLFYKRLDCPLNGMCPSEFYEREGEAEPFDPDVFLNMVNEGLRARERPDGSLRLRHPFSYPNPETSTTGGLLLRREGDEIVITDSSVPGIEGSVLECFLYHYDYLSDYAKEAQPYFDRFGGRITGENSFEFRTPVSDLRKGLYRVYSLTTVLSLFGTFIPF